jgi:hypothetical protein
MFMLTANHMVFDVRVNFIVCTVVGMLKVIYIHIRTCCTDVVVSSEVARFFLGAWGEYSEWPPLTQIMNFKK